jgi:hypothetical protein
MEFYEFLKLFCKMTKFSSTGVKPECNKWKLWIKMLYKNSKKNEADVIYMSTYLFHAWIWYR